MINITVDKNTNANENDLNLMRRFTKKVRSSGVLPRVRGLRYNTRTESKLTRKIKTLKSILKKKELEKQTKMGKVPEEKNKKNAQKK